MSCKTVNKLLLILIILTLQACIKPNRALVDIRSLQGVKSSLSKGIDVNTKYDGGDTPLIRAAEGERLEIIQVLLDHGADVNIKSNFGDTALIAAVPDGNLKIIQILLDHGADVKAKDRSGRTAFIRAVEMNQLEIAQILLDHGANVNAKDNSGRTALGHAQRWLADAKKELKRKGIDRKGAFLMVDNLVVININGISDEFADGIPEELANYFLDKTYPISEKNFKTCSITTKIEDANTILDKIDTIPEKTFKTGMLFNVDKGTWVEYDKPGAFEFNVKRWERMVELLKAPQ